MVTYRERGEREGAKVGRSWEEGKREGQQVADYKCELLKLQLSPTDLPPPAAHPPVSHDLRVRCPSGGEWLNLSSTSGSCQIQDQALIPPPGPPIHSPAIYLVLSLSSQLLSAALSLSSQLLSAALSLSSHLICSVLALSSYVICARY